MSPKSENKIPRLLRLRRFGGQSGSCSDLAPSGNEADQRYSRRDSSDLWNPRKLQIVLIPESPLNSDATGCRVRGTDWAGIPGWLHHRLFSNRAGALRVLAAAFGVLVVVLASLGLHDPLASMSSYTAALMALNQIAPPLLLLGLPRSIGVSLQGHGKGAALASLFLDPWAATMLFVLLSIAVSLPGVFDPSVVNALYTAPLGGLELLSGLLFWAQFMPATRRIRPAWLAGAVAWIGAIPMTVVAVVWMLSPDVLYTPYLDVVCHWNIPPLIDQRWAGFVMFVAGVPVQLVGVWLLLGCSHRSDPASLAAIKGKQHVKRI